MPKSEHPLLKESGRLREYDRVYACLLYTSIQYDQEAQSPYFTYRNQGREQEVWFEDVRSIAAKIELAKEYELYGVGYWNLRRPFRANWIMLE